MKAGGSSDRSLEHPIIWIAVIAGALGSILILKAVAWLAFPLIFAVGRGDAGTSIRNLFGCGHRDDADLFRDHFALDAQLAV